MSKSKADYIEIYQSLLFPFYLFTIRFSETREDNCKPRKRIIWALSRSS